MAQVSLQINGYGYILGCADGEEEHLRALASDLERRIEEIKASTGPTGEARMLLMAALVLSDELHDLREHGKQPDDDSASLKSESKSGRRLRGLAKRAEGIADSAEKPSAGAAATIAGSAAATPAVGQAPAQSRDVPLSRVPASRGAASGGGPRRGVETGADQTDADPPDGAPSGADPSGDIPVDGASTPGSGSAMTTPSATSSEP
jgi:cell division protein ZapA